MLGEAGAGNAVTSLLARDPAGHASLDDPRAVAVLLQALGEAGDGDAVTTLLARDPAGRQPRRPGGRRLAAGALGEAGAAARSPPWPPGPPATPASMTHGPSTSCCGRCARRGRHGVTALLARDPPATPASMTRGRPPLLQGREAGDSKGVTTLAARAADQASLDNPWAVALLLQALREAGARTRSPPCPPVPPPTQPLQPRARRLAAAGAARAGDSDAVIALAARAASAGMFHLFLEVHPDEASSYRFGREPDGAPSQSWKWQEP